MKNKYTIGQKVWHVSKESPEGIVLNAKYSLLTGLWEYEVSFSYSEVKWYYEHELSINRNF